MMKKCNRKGGFSIAEAIIALAVIVVVSMTALTIVLSSFAAKTTLITRSQGISFADNVWECFKAAEDLDEFKALVVKAGIVPDGDSFKIDNNTPFTYNSDEHKFKAEIIVKYVKDERPELHIVVKTDDDKSDEIISFSYVKGAKYYED